MSSLGFGWREQKLGLHPPISAYNILGVEGDSCFVLFFWKES